MAQVVSAVVGLDLSLASTGVAVCHAGGPAFVDTIATKGRRGDSLTERRERARTIKERIRTFFAHGALVVIEGPAHAAPGGSTWDRAGLWWAVVDMALDYGPVAVVAPATRAKWAAGSGRSDKAAVGAAMARRAPDVIATNADEVDALALAWMGAQWLGLLPATKAELAALAAVKWPEAAGG
jgi:crossover junction endodeoxyribonuclease RuvC